MSNGTTPSHPRGAVCYLNSEPVFFIGKHDIPRVAGLPGAEQSNPEADVRFSIATADGVTRAITAARLIIGQPS